MKPRQLSLIAGISYLIIFFAAIFANFFVIEAIKAEPLVMISTKGMLVRFGILAFLITVVFDVVVAWALFELYKEHALNTLSTYFRLMHAIIMGVAIYLLPQTLSLTSVEGILTQVNNFNTLWLIGLLFFGMHLILLGRIFQRPVFIAIFLILAGTVYIIDTTANFLMPNYQDYSNIFLTIVAIPSVIGEMSLAIWLIWKGLKSPL